MSTVPVPRVDPSGRADPVKRISLDQDNSLALYRQERELQEHADEDGHVIVGWVSDETVSGAVNLDDRASLGNWLHEPLLHEWDVMVVATTHGNLTAYPL